MDVPAADSGHQVGAKVTEVANAPGESDQPVAPDFDVVIVGAGFAGMYLLHRMRQMGLSARVIEVASDVGGTWFWNRYPGARCDIPSTDYTFTFDRALETAWTWSEKYATQPEILRYAQLVAQRLDLRRDIVFNTRVEAAHWIDDLGVWLVQTSESRSLRCRYLIMATGMLSQPKQPDLPGVERFEGRSLFTAQWPDEAIHFAGQRVAVIGTGSSGVQVIPEIAKQAASVTVFQRTPVFAIPARNGPPRPERIAWLQSDPEGYRRSGRTMRSGVPRLSTEAMGRTMSAAQRRERMQQAWDTGELTEVWGAFADMMSHEQVNAEMAEFARERIRAAVHDPVTAERLCPKTYPFGAKRPCLETDYFAAYNLPHVRLVDLKATPIKILTETGVELDDGESLAFDAIVYATGYDAITGTLLSMDIRGREGITLRESWASGPATYLGLMVEGFPNLFTITGPGTPAALTNVMASIEHHVDWVCACLASMRQREVSRIEPTPTAQAGWVRHCADWSALTLFPRADSWYLGANVPGKPRVFMGFLGGLAGYRDICAEVLQNDLMGFKLTGPRGETCRDGVVRALQPDVDLVLKTVAAMNLPPMESMTPDAARAFRAQMTAQRPPGPSVAQVRDGQMPGPDGGQLAWRLYRPESAHALPLIVYFHGGGWVLGDLGSDDPLCRDLCNRTQAAVLSVNYRHAPEARFPAAVDDAEAAVRWAAQHADELGASQDHVLVAGWSAGANLATIVCRRLRDHGGPPIRGQLLITPVVDHDFTRASYIDNGQGYGLTKDLMRWFWSHYADGADRSQPDASPLRAEDLSRLPPAVIVTSEFDPLRDAGEAYASALARAGVSVQHLRARGHTHLSLTMVDVIASGVPVREWVARYIRELF